MPRRLRRGDGAALFGLLWAASCVFLVALRLSPRDIAVSAPSASKSRVFEPKWTSDSVSNEFLTGKATLSLVESLPVGDFDLPSSVPQTFEALTRHVQAAKHSVHLSAMYWNLLGEEDRKVYSDAEMTRFGADRAKQNGETDEMDETTELSCNSLPSEVQMLVDAAKEDVQVSANMDWKSLAQVMEVGVVMENLSPTSEVIQDMKRLFETWWMFASPELLPAKTDSYFSERFQHELQVPKWSLYLPGDTRSEDPFVKAGLSALANISCQLQTPFSTFSDENDTERDAETAEMFVAAAPLEATAAHSRAFDEDALVYTIRSAKSFVSLSVMDFVPFSMYTPGPLHWPALTDALLAGVYSKPGLQVRLLISQWQHTSPQMLEALATLKNQADLCQHTHARCSGRLEIKIFRVPGWQNTTSSAGTKASWPSYTRVNHAKYIVTDTRANVGTSNMEWGYFYTTAGASVNTNHESTRKALENIFERNWNSSYAKRFGGNSIW
ncbi:hypothetical protein JG687_00004954 [Phytophthora cactorum]|uniref:PLD phosphodiesterase domain-containing protein n=1 Tax=Phytophthora cactorum TaxID=29920 RepID=A0A8T1UMA5_9STRA|nr:hypothetical protein JG687_00004954 [Phytophthora cactorum]